MDLRWDDPRFDREDRLIHRTSGTPGAPALIYLPGVHGDWTPFAGLRPLLGAGTYLIETSYPRSPRWEREDFTGALERLMDEAAIESAHLLGESFGSIVAWEFALTRPGRVRSLVFAGGFAQTPRPPIVRLLRLAIPLVPAPLFHAAIGGYIGWRRLAGGYRAGAAPAGECFPAARTRRGLRAIGRRLELIQRAEFRARISELACPAAYLGGSRDWVVPVRREIRTLRAQLGGRVALETRLIPRAPHPILPARPVQAAAFILDWIARAEASRDAGRDRTEG